MTDVDVTMIKDDEVIGRPENNVMKDNEESQEEDDKDDEDEDEDDGAVEEHMEEDGGSEEDEGNGESGSPNPSAARNLKKDLELTLSMNFNFKGKFAFASKLPNAPNPGLQIAPVGLIGLPLSERDAQTIKAMASQAPFGHGDQLVVDTTVRHTWEIEPANTITFANPEWTSFIELVIKRACAELEVIPSSKLPKCELYKLLLYEAGSHFMPHRDTEKAPGMFATIVIVLPSFYCGAQVCVTHGSERQVFDFSSDAFATSMLTWYADVTHEVKPITSGYRLALTYNLIQEETSLPLPSVPSESSAVLKLRSIFNKWSKGAYGTVPRRIAYVLVHEYSKVDLDLGEKALKGADAHLVRTMRQIAAEEGVAFALAELECHVVGSASEDFDAYGGYHKRSRYYYESSSDDYDNGVPTIGEEMSQTTSISSLVDLDGKPLIKKGSISLGAKQLIPSDPFKDVEPDDRDYEGYMGNYPGDVQYWYHRVVIVFYLERDAHDFLLEAEGPEYAISQLKARDNNQPSSLDMKFANYAVDHLKSYNLQYNLGKDREWTLYILNVALRWKDSSLWLKTASKIGAEQNLNFVGDDRLAAAWDVFGFEILRPLFEKAIAQRPSLKAQMDLIDSFPRRVRSEDDRARVKAWCNEHRALALAHMKVPVKDDVPVIIDVLKTKGMGFFVDSIEPQLLRYESQFGFLLAFVRALHEEKALLSNPPSDEAIYKQAVRFCLKLATDRCGQWASINEIKELVEVALLTEETGFCETLFVSLIQDKANLDSKFKNIFTPLVAWLRHLLNICNIPLNSHPFGDFFRYLIETFLVSMLGAKIGQTRHNAVRKIGCGCTHCQELDRFLFSTDAAKQFRYNETQRKHLENRLRDARDVATFKTIKEGRPHILEVKKHADIVAAATWEGRQKSAKRFLSHFGGDAAIRLIMGSKCADVARAISGEKAYPNVVKPYSSSVLATKEPAQVAQSSLPQQASGSSDTAAHQPLIASREFNAPVGSPAVAGVKRKNLGLIDLSSSP